MPEYEITLTGTPLAIDASWTIEQLYQAMLHNIGGTISNSNIIVGKVGGTIPASDIGVWLDGLIWKAWYPTRTVTDAAFTNGDKTVTSSTIEFSPSDIGKTITGTYADANTTIESVTNPGSAEMSNAATGGTGLTTSTLTFTGNAYHSIVPTIGSNGLYVSLVANLTGGDKLVEFQDRDGTVALLDDVYTPRVTNFPTMNAVATPTVIDWSVSSSFGLPLDKNVLLTMSNFHSGQEVTITAFNGPSLAYTIDWASTGVHWDGAAPTQDTNDKTTVYVIRCVGGVLYGAVMGTYA